METSNSNIHILVIAWIIISLQLENLQSQLLHPHQRLVKGKSCRLKSPTNPSSTVTRPSLNLEASEAIDCANQKT